MAIARVSVLEFDSQEALEHAQKSHKLMRAKVFPHLKMCLCVRTGPTSFIDISVYPSEEAAEANLEDRQKFHEEAFGESFDETVVLFSESRIVFEEILCEGHMVGAIGRGAAVYMKAASKVQAS